MNNTLSKVSSWFGGLILLITVIYIIFFDPTKFNPDYGSYEKLYTIIKNADFRIYFNKFAFLDYFVRIFDFTGTYYGFRLIFASIEVFLFFIIVKSLKIGFKSLTFFISLTLSAFLLIKIHVQIREGFALLLWFLSLSSIQKEKYISLKNLIFFLISSLLHTSTLIFWISTFILKYKNFSSKTKRSLIVILFSLIGFSIWPFFANLIAIDYYDLINFESIDTSSSKILYWLSFLVIFLLIFKSENSKITFTNQKSIENINSSYIGNIGFYGFIGFVPIAGLTFLTGAANEGTFNLIFRIVLNLLFLISFYRSSSQPTNFYTNILNSFIFIVVLRLLLFPNIN